MSLMSAETFLMKNLIDMGIVQTQNQILQSDYITPDKNYIIRLKRQSRLFLSEESDSKYTCTIEFLTSFESSILTIVTSEIEISKMIDSFYFMIEYGDNTSVYHFFNPIDTNCISRVFGLYIPETISAKEFYTNIFDKKLIFAVYDYIDERMIQRIVINMNTKSVYELLEKLYYVFLIDKDDNSKMY